MIEILAYGPVLRGFILLLIAGFVFPVSGVFIIRLNMLPIRFLLMHGVLLGGAAALAFGIDPSWASLAVNMALILFLNRSSEILKTGYAELTMFFMVVSVAAASVIISSFDVPAKDTLVLLWGSLYVTDYLSISAAAVLGLIIIFFTVRYFRHLTAVFFDRDVALSMGINAGFFNFTIMVIIALVISISMRLTGALLLDALILLPAIISGLFVSGFRQTIFFSSLFGGIFSITGFFISLYFNIPVSAGVAIPSAIAFAVIIILKKGVFYESRH